jgi:1-aminocyclopropane-1-carboxylate deaminase/D-cysteine desulfhydrase-like pyridoxal-dependent ACC family enzyme
MTTLVTRQDLRARLDRLPRLRLAHLPTPLEELSRLSAHLGGPRLLVKREDLTGLAFGGNKIREFEYQIAQAVKADCDVLVHSAAAQSNQSRQTAAVAARLGLKAVIVGRRDAHAQVQGNLLLTHLLGAEVHLPEPAEQQAAVAACMEALWQQGHKPFHTSTDARAYRSIAYVDGALELLAQIEELGEKVEAVYLCSGAYTHVGLVVAFKALGAPIRVVGISPSPRDDRKAAQEHAALARQTAAILGLESLGFSPEDFESYATFAGPAYGVLTPESRQAIQVLARQEGLLLDPCYTGKAMAGLMAHVRAGWWKEGQRLIFIHTGGTPALFAYAEELGA